MNQKGVNLVSKYTTEVRFICETEAGLTESVGYSKVNEVLDKSWDKIFDAGDWDIYDEEYRPILCKKILKHFYTREIGAETAGLWKLWLNQRMAEIMPYYNQLYKSTLLEFNPLYDTDYKTEGNRKTDEDEQSGRETNSDYTRTDNLQNKRTDDLTSQRTDNLNSTRTDNLQQARTDNLQQVRNDNLHENTSDTRYDLYSDTPQGALTGVESETYLTNARKVTDIANKDNTGTQTTDNTGTQTTDNTGTQDLKNTGTQTVDNTGTQTVENTGTVNNIGSDTENSKRVLNNTQDYVEHVIGKRGTQSYAKMIMELRDSFVNIDMMIIDELNDLFFNLW